MTTLLVGFILSLSPPVQALPPYGATTAGITDASRDPDTYGDFLRAIWVSPGTQVTYLGRNDSSVKKPESVLHSDHVRPTRCHSGPIRCPGRQLLPFRSGPRRDAMQALRRQRQTVSPILATWPSVFTTVVNDFQGAGYTCPANPNDGNNVMFCAAQGYQDSQQSVFVTGLSTALTAATQIFNNSGSSPGAIALKTNYGIYPTFTGLGFSAAGSGTVPTMSTTQVLRESIVPEYLLVNTTLADAGCRCIQVPQLKDGRCASYEADRSELRLAKGKTEQRRVPSSCQARRHDEHGSIAR